MNLVPKPGQLKIGMLRLGGIGDSLQLAAQAGAVRRKYKNSHITLFIRDMISRDLIDGHPAVARIVVVGDRDWQQKLELIKQKDFDIIYDNRYVTKAIYRDANQFPEDVLETDLAFKPFEGLYEDFPMSNNRIGNLGKRAMELMFETVCIKGLEDDLYICLTQADCNMAMLLAQDRYITVHNGADIARQTKCWPTERWNQIVRFVRNSGLADKVIQLGAANEEAIAGTVDMRGRTSIKEAAALIAGARYHVDTEGGLVHVARAMGTRSVVLFGPTPVDFFGYPENINIAARNCGDCWWKTGFWWRECPRGFQQPVKCMDSIKVGEVADAITEIDKLPYMENRVKWLQENEQFAMELSLDEGHYKAEPWQWDRIYTMMDEVKGKKVLEVGAGDGYCAQVLKKRGFEVVATEVSRIRLERIRSQGIDAVYGDVLDLPFPDNSYDCVICGEVLEHIDSMARGLSELERVCKPEGKIIISLPIADEYRKLEFHRWGIGHHEILRDGTKEFVVLTLMRINRKCK